MATRTWRGTTNSNWSVTTNWLEGAVPTISDDVIFDASSPNCVLNVVGTCLSIDWTAFTNTITFTNPLNVYGNVTLGSAMTIAGTGALNLLGNSTITSNGVAWPNTLNFSLVGGVFTINGNWQNIGNVTQLSGSPVTFNGNSLICSSSLTGTSSPTIGNALFRLIGTGNLSGSFSNPIEIDTAGTITLGASFGYGLNANPNLFKHISGNVIIGNNTFNITGSCSLDCEQLFFNSVIFSTTSSTISLISDFNTLDANAFSYTTINGKSLNVYRNFSISRTLSGNGLVNFLGNGEHSLSTNEGAFAAFNINVNVKSIGFFKVINPLYITSSVFSIISNSINATNMTLNVIGSATLIGFNKIKLKEVIITPGITLTMNEFFSGTPYAPCKVYSNGALYNINFTDTKEKTAKFVTVRNANILNKCQLMVITSYNHQVPSQTTNVGVRYINQLPNGISKNEASTTNQAGYPLNGMVSDPNMIKRL